MEVARARRVGHQGHHLAAVARQDDAAGDGVAAQDDAEAVVREPDLEPGRAAGAGAADGQALRVALARAPTGWRGGGGRLSLSNGVFVRKRPLACLQLQIDPPHPPPTPPMLGGGGGVLFPTPTAHAQTHRHAHRGGFGGEGGGMGGGTAAAAGRGT